VIDGFLLLAGVLLGLGSAALPSLAWMILASVTAIAWPDRFPQGRPLKKAVSAALSEK